MTPQDFGLMNPWLEPSEMFTDCTKKKLDAIKDKQLRYDRLIELDVQRAMHQRY